MRATVSPLTFILSPLPRLARLRRGERRMFLGLSDSLLRNCWGPTAFWTTKWTVLRLGSREKRAEP